MISKNINNWLNIIENMNNDNTYKLVWGRAILECISTEVFLYSNHKILISFDDIAKNILKYYWNQIFYFNLKQSPYKNKEPIICRLVISLIDRYKEITNSNIPCWFDVAKTVLVEKDVDTYNNCVKFISKALHENVSYRFLNVQSEIINIYELDDKNSLVVFDENDAKEVQDYAFILSQLLNFKWAQLLEKFNFAPNISMKVKGLSDAKLRRSSLSKYKDILLKEFEDGNIRDFYTDKILEYKDISIDHVIPWSFMYSDDIWNLVITSKSNNSSKSNSVPEQRFIEKLKERNNNLESIISDSYREDLVEARMNGYVDKFYLNMRL